jgi:hypothetical protein
VIAALLGAIAGEMIGRRIGRAHGERIADETAWRIAEHLAPRPFVVHSDGTVES